jgi:hypothetical protein
MSVLNRVKIRIRWKLPGRPAHGEAASSAACRSHGRRHTWHGLVDPNASCLLAYGLPFFRLRGQSSGGFGLALASSRPH